VAEAMSEAVLAEMERNAHVRCDCGSCDGDSFGLTGREAAVLLAEARRARQAEAELRAAQPQLTDEYGLRIRHISTLTEERAIADTLDGALEVLAAFDAKGRADVVSRELLVRGVEEWRKVAGR
jgi:hypothetical protein